MLVFSTKITKRKIIAFSLILACLALILIISIPSKDASADKQNKTVLSSNQDRIDYLANYGWSVSNDPVEIVEIVIPAKFDNTYESYNVLQQTQGFDLSAYKGKKATRYTYEVKNYPSTEKDTIHANLLLLDNRLIGGDITSVALGGFMHGFDMPKDSSTNVSGKNTNTNQNNTSSTNTDNEQGKTSGTQTAGPSVKEIMDEILANTDK